MQCSGQSYPSLVEFFGWFSRENLNISSPLHCWFEVWFHELITVGQRSQHGMKISRLTLENLVKIFCRYQEVITSCPPPHSSPPFHLFKGRSGYSILSVLLNTSPYRLINLPLILAKKLLHTLSNIRLTLGIINLFWKLDGSTPVKLKLSWKHLWQRS